MKGKKPDFQNLISTLYCRESRGVPLIEILVDREVKEAFLRKPVKDVKTDIEFWCEAGYDYFPVTISIFGVAGQESKIQGMYKVGTACYSFYSETEQTKDWAIEGKGIITTWDEFKHFLWPDPQEVDLSIFEEAPKYLPSGMKIIGIVSRLFMATWMLMGFETFCFALGENTKLVEAIFEKVGYIQFEVFKRIITQRELGAMWLGDDIAYSQGLLVSPLILRRYVFPWYKKMGDLCKERGIPFLFHSDGNLLEVINDLIDCSINALHPIEPKAMDAKELKAKFGRRLCLLGNIDVDRLSRGTPQEIRELTRWRMDELGKDGGYCAGSSNSVTNYIPLENYIAMIETALSQSFKGQTPH